MRFVTALLLSLVATTPALAFNRSTYEKVALDSLRLAPPDLARLADRHHDQLVEGVLTPLATEGGAEHLAEPRGVMERRIQEQTDRIIGLINKRTPFDKVVYELGILCHYVADLNNPLNTATDDPRYERIRKDFEGYVSRKTPKFVLTFNGHGSTELRAHDVLGFARAAAERSANFGPFLSRSYYPGGAMVTSKTFDDRHTAFGVASITFQNAVGDCARLFVYIWQQVNGDLRGTPFYGDSKTTAQTSGQQGTFRW